MLAASHVSADHHAVATALIRGRAGSIGPDRIREALRQHETSPSGDEVAAVAELIRTAHIDVTWGEPGQG